MMTLEYDLIIIGSGPSAAGLLHRILLDLVSNHNNDINDLRIAILERGGQNDSATLSTPWFTAAHYSDASIAHVHTSAPQSSLNYRQVDVPTGFGLGGTTNVYAGLLVEPCYNYDFKEWPGKWRGGHKIREAVRDIRFALTEYCQSKIDIEAKNNHDMNNGKSNTNNDHDNFNVGKSCNCCCTGDGTSATTGKPAATTNRFCCWWQEPNFERDTISFSSCRINFFTALIEPILRKHPEIHTHVDILQGMLVERILIQCPSDPAADPDILNTHTPRAWAVECLISSNYNNNPDSNHFPHATNCPNYSFSQRVLIQSRREVILCAGAIGSPSILLASGIGDERDLKAAGIDPWWWKHSQVKRNSNFDNREVNSIVIYRNLPVGHNLRDHVLLPRVFVTTYCRKEKDMSCNSVQGWWNVDLSFEQSNTLILTARNVNDSYYDTDNTVGFSDPYFARIQLQLADGSQMDKMVPHFAAAAFRRNWDLFFSRFVYGFTKFFQLILPSTLTFSQLFPLLRHIIETLLFNGVPMFSLWLTQWTRQHTFSINICLMNPKSVGKLSIIHHHSSDLSLDSSICFPSSMQCTSFSPLTTTTRLSECHVIIDPGYLSDPQDREALWRGWNASNKLLQSPNGQYCKRKVNEKSIEILPGYTFLILQKIVSSIKWMVHWLQILIVGRLRDTSKRSPQRPSASTRNTVMPWFACYASEFANPYYHWCGTCTIGADDEEEEEIINQLENHKACMQHEQKLNQGDVQKDSHSVVDEYLCVRGISGLRVCDASVFPTCLSAPTALTCAALGYASYDVIFQNK